MKTLAIVRIVVFALLLVYTLYAMPWSYIVSPQGGRALATGYVIADVKALVMATWLARGLDRHRRLPELHPAPPAARGRLAAPRGRRSSRLAP